MYKSNHSSSVSEVSTPSILFFAKSVTISYIISIVMLFAVSLIATFQALSDTSISILVNIVTALGTTISGFMSGRHFDSKGLLFGALSGLIYTLILCIIGNIISASLNFGLSFITSLIIGVICGAVGGISGINTKRTRRR